VSSWCGQLEVVALCSFAGVPARGFCCSRQHQEAFRTPGWISDAHSACLAMTIRALHASTAAGIVLHAGPAGLPLHSVLVDCLFVTQDVPVVATHSMRYGRLQAETERVCKGLL
jgi:hypothetical protein